MLNTINWIVDQLPSATPDEEVEAQFRSRCNDARNKGHEITPERETEIVSQAVRQHAENRRIAEFEAWALED